MAKCKLLKCRIFVTEGDKETVPWETLSPEEQERVKKKMLEGANRSWNDYIAELQYRGV